MTLDTCDVAAPQQPAAPSALRQALHIVFGACAGFVIAWGVMSWQDGSFSGKKAEVDATPSVLPNSPALMQNSATGSASEKKAPFGIPVPENCRRVYNLATPVPGGARYMGCFESDMSKVEICDYYKYHFEKAGWLARVRMGKALESKSIRAISYVKGRAEVVITFFDPFRRGGGCDFMVMVNSRPKVAPAHKVAGK